MDYGETHYDSDYEHIDMDVVMMDSRASHVSASEFVLQTTDMTGIETQQQCVYNDLRSSSLNVHASPTISNFMEDTDYDSEEMSIENEGNRDRYDDSSDTSDEDSWFGNLSPASSDSSLAEYGENMGFFELMNQHLEIFNHEADSFFRVSLRTLYQTLIEYMEERGGPTPQDIIDSLPTLKVTIAQIASNLTCTICFAEYEQDEDLLKLPCNHLYHKSCIVSWLKLKSTCPTCRLDLSKESNRSSSASTNSYTEDINNRSNVNNGSTHIDTTNETFHNSRSEVSLSNTASLSDRDIVASSSPLTENFYRVSSTSTGSADQTNCLNSTSSVTDCSGSSSNNTNSSCTHIRNSSTSIEGASNVVRTSSSTSRTKRSTTLTATTTKRYSRETEIW